MEEEIRDEDENGEVVTQSPRPSEVDRVDKITDTVFEEVNNFDFYKAIKAIKSGAKVRRVGWDDIEYYLVLDSDTIKIHKPDGKLYSWIISSEDIDSLDYIKI